MIIEELVAMLGYDIRGEANLQRFNANLDKTAAIAGRVATALVAAGTLAAGAMLAFGKGVVNVSAQFEGFETSLTTIEGSAEKAKKSMDWIAQFAAKTPYELDGVTEAFIKLRAYGFDPMDGSLATLGDTASAMNKPLMQAVEAFADAATMEFERLKEFGIKAKQKGEEVTFTWQEGGKEMSKTVKKTGKDVTKFLLDVMGRRFNGAMIRQSKTWNGMMSNLSDSWAMFQKRVGDAGFFPLIKSRLADLMDYLGKLSDDGTLDKWAKNLSDGLSWGLDTAVGLIKGLAGDIKFLYDLVKGGSDWAGPLLTGLKALALFIFPKTAGIFILIDVLRWLQGKASAISDLAKALNELTGIDVGTLERVLVALALGLGAFLLFGGTFLKVAGGIRALALALGLMGGTSAAAGTAALTGIASGSIATGLLAISAAAAAAAGSIKLFYDAWKNDEKLNAAIKEKVAPGLFNWISDNLLGTNSAEDQYWRSGQGEKDNAQRKKDEARRNAKVVKGVNDPNDWSTPAYGPDDWRMEEQRKEAARMSQPQGGGLEKLWGIISNINSHLSAMSAGAIDKAVNATISDNRSFPTSVSTAISMTVTTAVDGAMKAAQTVAGAVNKAAVPEKSRVNTGAHF